MTAVDMTAAQKVQELAVTRRVDEADGVVSLHLVEPETDVFWSNDVVRAERDVFLAAAIAATLDATNLSEDPSSRSNERLLAAVRQTADVQGECLHGRNTQSS